jgi:hypothetical protein
LYVLVNEIMKQLRQQQDHAPEFGEILAAIVRDKKIDPVIRDYAVQHLGEWCLVNELDADIEAVLHEALAETRSSIAGTALIALAKVDSEASLIPPASVDAAAIELATDSSANAGSRATAIAICGTRGLTNALPAARSSAQSQSMSLQLSSLAYVGQYGETKDQDWLAEIATNEQDTVAASAKTAMERIAIRSSNSTQALQHKGES